MKPFRKLKVGLAGVMCTPFRGDKETQYREAGAGLDALAERAGFAVHVVRQGIYNPEQASSAAVELSQWGADFILLQTSSFASGAFLYEFTRLPCFLGIWAVPEGAPSSEGGLPLNSFAAANLYNSIVKTTLTDYDRPVKWFFGPPGQPLFDDRLSTTVRALSTLINLRDSRVGLLGGVAPGFDNLIVDERKLNRRLGIRVVPVEFDVIISRAESASRERVTQAGDAIRSGAARLDAGQERALEKSGRVLASLEQIAGELDLDALALSCWPRFQSDYHFAVCSVVGQANTIGLITACEGDVTSAVSMLALKHLSGGVVTLMDLVSFDESDNSILLWHCGPTSPALADEKGASLGSLWLFDGYGGEPIGLHNDLVLRPGTVTVAGFTTDFERILVLGGEIDNQKPSYRGSRGWMKSLRMNGEPIPTLDLVETLLSSGFQHHYPLAYGELAEAFIELGAWIGIPPIEARSYSPGLRLP